MKTNAIQAFLGCIDFVTIIAMLLVTFNFQRESEKPH